MDKKSFKGVIKLDVRDSKPDWEPYTPTKAPAGAPNILFVLIVCVSHVKVGCGQLRHGDGAGLVLNARHLVGHLHRVFHQVQDEDGDYSIKLAIFKRQFKRAAGLKTDAGRYARRGQMEAGDLK
jgi:hypothetical protein